MPRHQATRDHYVPRFLLRNWERDQDGKRIFWVYEKKTGKVHPGSAKATHFEYNYDRFTTDLGREHSFQEDFGALETRAAHAVRACLAALRPPTGPDREHLAIFLALQLCRVPAARDMATALVEGSMVQFCQGLSRRPAALKGVIARYEADTGESLGDPEKLREALARTGTDLQVTLANPKYARLLVMSTWAALVPHIHQLAWSICRTRADRPFLTGDTPFCVTAPDPLGSGGWLVNAGIGVDGAEGVFPVCPETALVLSRLQRQDVWIASERRVADINERIAAAATDTVVAPIRSKGIEELVARVATRQADSVARVELRDTSASKDLLVFLPQTQHLSHPAPVPKRGATVAPSTPPARTPKRRCGP